MNIVKAKWRESGIHLQNGPASRIPRVFKSRPGFTLLEILVSLVVMSVGILGVTAMQAASVNGQVLSRNLGTAFNVVHDALDRMQTNSEDITDYIKNSYTQPFVVTVDRLDTNPSDNAERPASGTVAASDYDAIYNAMLDMGLSSGVLTVTLYNDVPVTGVDKAEALLSWNYKGDLKTCEIHTIITKEGR